MSSLRQVLAEHSPTLLVDAASSRIQVGWFDRNGPARWQTSDEEAGIGIFRCLEGLGTDVNAIAAFVFCEGPGSILGIRTVAMALRAWNVLTPRPTFAYISLAIVAHALADPRLRIIADARRETWHEYHLGGVLSRISSPDLGGSTVTPELFRHWTPLPPGTAVVSYDLAALLPQVHEADLLQRTEKPEAFLHEEPSYATWAPHIHRAPVSS